VTTKNEQAIHYLLWGGADPSLQNSNKKTPLQLAEKLNKKDSHKAIIAALKKC
jgi:hypothetical protein